jgi:hypothetical protein
MGHALSEEVMQILNAISGILLRCFIITVVALLFVWTTIMIMGDSFYYIYSIFFDIPRKNYDQLLLYSLTFMKVLNVLFFLFPFLAIKHFLRDKNKNPHENR